MTILTHALAFFVGGALVRRYPQIGERIAGWVRQIKRR